MYCSKCGVHMRTYQTRCPLCQGALTGAFEENGQIFPRVGRDEIWMKALIKIAAFCSLVAVAVCIGANLYLHRVGGWSLFVIAGIGSFWLSFAVVLKKKDNIHKTIVWQTVIISGMAVLWDIFTGFHGWSVDFVIPVMCICAMIAMSVIAQITKLHIEDYMIYVIIDSCLGILSATLIILDIIHFILPSVICITASIISLGTLFIFEGRAMRTELRRRLHL